MKTIATSWDSYRDQVLPKDASPVQVSECRRAFHAGAYAVLGVLNQVSEPAISEEEGMQILDGLQRECRSFVEDVAAGRA